MVKKKEVIDKRLGDLIIKHFCVTFMILGVAVGIFAYDVLTALAVEGASICVLAWVLVAIGILWTFIGVVGYEGR